jgi:hypothetical protein
MMSGQRPDARWYWKDGAFLTDLGAAPPPSVVAANAAAKAIIDAPATPPMPVPAACARRDRPVQISQPRIVGTGRFAHGKGEREFRYSPALDAVTLGLATGLVDEYRLGRGPASDVLALSLSATDYVGHRYGSNGLEMCLQLHALDQALGDFLAGLDSRRIDYAVVLTADHGGEDMPERLRLEGMTDASRTPKALQANEIGKRIADALGRSRSTLIGEASFGDIYFDPTLNPADRARAEALALKLYRERNEVAQIFTRAELAAHPLPSGPPDRWTLADRARASFDVERSGDLIVLLKKHLTPIPAPDDYYAAGHGSPWDYDRRVPILFWRRGMAASANDAPVMTVDILPTLAAMLGLAIDPATIDGRCLSGISGATCPAH